jgi:hypothetical protein
LLNLGENPKSLTVGFFETWELVEIPWDIEIIWRHWIGKSIFRCSLDDPWFWRTGLW